MAFPAHAAGSGVCVPDNVKTNSSKGDYKCCRPAKSERLFHSEAVEKEIKRVKSMLTNKKLAWMFENCFPNTIDTTVHFRVGGGRQERHFRIYRRHTRDVAPRFRCSGVNIYVQARKLRPCPEGNGGGHDTPPVQMYQHRPVCQRLQRRTDRRRMDVRLHRHAPRSARKEMGDRLSLLSGASRLRILESD